MATITINITAEGPKAAEDALASMKSLVEAAQVQTLAQFEGIMLD